MSHFGALVLGATGAPSVKHPVVFVRFDSISCDNNQEVCKDVKVAHDFLEDRVHYLKPTLAIFLRNNAIVEVSRETLACVF